MGKRQRIRECARTLFFCLLLAVPALCGSPANAGDQKPNPEGAVLPASQSGISVTFDRTPEHERARQLLLLGNEPAPPDGLEGYLQAVPEVRVSEATVTSANYIWDSTLWGRLDCLRQQRIRQGLFGSRNGRCSLG